MTRGCHRYLIAYDISDDRRRAQLAKVLERYGDRVQYSVFVVECSTARLVRLRTRIAEVIVKVEDSVLVCDLGVAESLPPWSGYYLGRPRPIAGRRSIVV